MSSQILVFLLNAVLGFFSLALLLRFYFQLFRLPFRHPVSQFLVTVTSFLVRPVRRFIPGWNGADLSSLLLAWLIECLLLLGILMLQGYSLDTNTGTALSAIALLGMIEIAKMSLYIILFSVIFQVVLSWINPHSALAPLLDGLSRPFLNIFRRRIPLVANIDLSPLFVILVVQVLLIIIAGVHQDISGML